MSVRVTAVGETTSLADRKRRAGQRLALGFLGSRVTDDVRRLIVELRPSVFVMLAKNLEDEPGHALELTRELRALGDPSRPALVALDQEGGRVQSLRGPATRWPSARVVGQAGDPALTERFGRAMARELRVAGFDLNFAPVADVATQPDANVPGDRAFGEDPDLVARHVAPFVRGLQGEGIGACAKHFPGHGAASGDSHATLPVAERTERELRETELPPFRAAVEAGVASVMTAHVIYPEDDETYPATLSERVVPRRLRKDLAFDGVVFSDDLEMKAIRPRWGPEELARRCTLASVDVLMSCDDPEHQHALYGALVRAQEEDPAMERAAITHERRVNALRERILLDRPASPPPSVLGCEEHRSLALELMARGGW